MDKISIDDFAKVDLRAAKVLDCKVHPNGDKLLILQVDVGDEQKQIVAGLRQYYPPESLIGRTILVVNNLEPVVLRGESSSGMVLTTTASDGIPLIIELNSTAPGCRLK